jgi:membrane-associated protease RseP (regulator of RpoE activity)
MESENTMTTVMKRVLAGASAVSLAAILFAHPGHAPIAPPKVSFALTPASIPFELFRGQRIILSGTVNGHSTPMMLESGAGMTVIDQAYAKQIGLAGGTTIQVRGATGESPAQIASGVSLAAGSLHLDNLSVLIVDLSAIARSVGRPIPVLLGSEAFKAGTVTVDFPRSHLTFADRSKFTPPPVATRVALGERQRIPTIDVSVAGLPPVTADLDLGNNGTLIVSNSFWKDQPMLSSLRHAQWATGGVGGMKVSRQVTVPSVDFAGRRFLNVPAILNDDPQTLPLTGANVGVGMFKPFVATFDFAGQVIYLEGPKEVRALPRERAGVRTELDGDHLDVVYVSPEGPAAAAGLKVGDDIVAIDGRAVGHDYYSRAEWSYGAAGRAVTLARADGSKLIVKLRDYY